VIGVGMLTSLFLKMLNKQASSPGNKSREIVESLQIQEGHFIADIGSGGGYFTLEFVRKVGKTGRVYAVDTQPKNLAFIKRQFKRDELHNVVFVLTSGNKMHLPGVGLDLVFIRNTFHHLPEPAKYFRSVRAFLKPSGRVAIIENKPKHGFSFVAIFKHYTPVETILREMEKAGYHLMQSFDFLPRQTFTLFGLK
jgi:arsenite methyltransferase